VNDVTYSQSCVTVLKIKGCTFVELINPAIRATFCKRKQIMKKAITFILILLFGGATLFAQHSDHEKDAHKEMKKEARRSHHHHGYHKNTTVVIQPSAPRPPSVEIRVPSPPRPPSVNIQLPSPPSPPRPPR
jgi:ABC-type nickel/cobalt efflux system permease component RcnA